MRTQLSCRWRNWKLTAVIFLALPSAVQAQDSQGRTTNSCKVEAFELVDIYSEVTGHLRRQMVDLGSRVKMGEVLAEIHAPQLLKDLDLARAHREMALAHVEIAKARVDAGKGELRAAKCQIEQAKAELGAATALLKRQDSETKRFKELAEKKAIDSKLVDTQMDALEAARLHVEAARAAVELAETQMLIKRARLQQDEAEVTASKAAVRAADAALDKAKVVVAMTRIIAPFDGIITRRFFGPGSHILAHGHGAKRPLFRLERIDRVRVVTVVPETAASLVKVGDAALITLYALPKKQFKAAVSRTAYSLDGKGALRVECDLVNPQLLLRAGMNGEVAIQLGKKGDS